MEIETFYIQRKNNSIIYVGICCKQLLKSLDKMGYICKAKMERGKNWNRSVKIVGAQKISSEHIIGSMQYKVCSPADLGRCNFILNK